MKEKYLEDIQEIRDIMNRSTRFISLSGLSGISAGIIGLIGAYLASQWIYTDPDFLSFHATVITTATIQQILILSTGTLITGLGAAIIFTTRKTRQQNQQIWDATTRRLLVSFFLPLITGAVVCLIFLSHGFIGLLPALTLIFYGLGMVNAGKYTIPEVRQLGIIDIILGILSLIFIEYSLLLWAIGFGFLHILSGIIVHRKYAS